MLHILLVDDNILNSKIMAYYLQEKYLVCCVYNGFEAIKTFKEKHFDVIIMDLMMPEIDGYETTKQIRMIESEEKRERLIPIIALTANVYDNDREKCLAAGMNDFMVKPINLIVLQEIFNELGITEVI